MDKELTVPKWVPIVRPKIPQMPQKISAQNVCPSPKTFEKKNSLWVSVVRGLAELKLCVSLGLKVSATLHSTIAQRVGQSDTSAI